MISNNNILCIFIFISVLSVLLISFSFCSSSSWVIPLLNTWIGNVCLYPQILPDGLRGLLSSVILSALVTSLASIFHSSATVFTLDLWSRIHRSASVQELMVMGRVSVLVLVVISIGLIPFVQKVLLATLRSERVFFVGIDFCLFAYHHKNCPLSLCLLS